MDQKACKPSHITCQKMTDYVGK